MMMIIMTMMMMMTAIIRCRHYAVSLIGSLRPLSCGYVRLSDSSLSVCQSVCKSVDPFFNLYIS